MIEDATHDPTHPQPGVEDPRDLDVRHAPRVPPCEPADFSVSEKKHGRKRVFLERFSRPDDSFDDGPSGPAPIPVWSCVPVTGRRTWPASLHATLVVRCSLVEFTEPDRSAGAT